MPDLYGMEVLQADIDTMQAWVDSQPNGFTAGEFNDQLLTEGVAANGTDQYQLSGRLLRHFIATSVIGRKNSCSDAFELSN